jgi:hypothetical protein
LLPNIAVKQRAQMQRQIHIGGRQAVGAAPEVQLGEARARLRGRRKC